MLLEPEIAVSVWIYDPEMLYELENVSEKIGIRNCRHSMVAIIINISLILGAYYLHK